MILYLPTFLRCSQRVQSTADAVSAVNTPSAGRRARSGNESLGRLIVKRILFSSGVTMGAGNSSAKRRSDPKRQKRVKTSWSFLGAPYLLYVSMCINEWQG